MNAPATQRLPARQVFAVVAGNALEFYDFVTYAFFAAQIGRTFFPSDTPGTSLLASLATFGVGFLTRPLGALVIGRYADRAGASRRCCCRSGSWASRWSACRWCRPTPTIGVAAPLLVIAFRLLQGFALGGEVGPNTAFLMEAAPPLRRGFYISLQATSADVAVMVAGLVGVALASLLDAAAARRLGLARGAVARRGDRPVRPGAAPLAPRDTASRSAGGPCPPRGARTYYASSLVSARAAWPRPPPPTIYSAT